MDALAKLATMEEMSQLEGRSLQREEEEEEGDEEEEEDEEEDGELSLPSGLIDYCVLLGGSSSERCELMTPHTLIIMAPPFNLITINRSWLARGLGHASFTCLRGVTCVFFSSFSSSRLRGEDEYADGQWQRGRRDGRECVGSLPSNGLP